MLELIESNLFNNELNNIFRVFNNAQHCDLKTNIFKIENGYNVQVLIPGITKEEVEIVLKDNKTLVISINKDKKVLNKNTTLLKEFTLLETTSKSLYFDKEINQEYIDASITNGILNINLKELEQKKKKILIT